jgi:hypothetical protein
MSSIVPGEMTDNGACNVYAFPTNPPIYVAATETCLLRQIDPATLETLPNKIDLSSVVNIAGARPGNKDFLDFGLGHLKSLN